jgi:glutamine amidotransferase
MIAVLDYGIGNLRSAEKALLHVGGDAVLVREPEDVVGAVGVVLPGVGAFGACARALRDSGLGRVAHAAVEQGLPFLGICVGFQLLFARSTESPDERGLGVIEGEIERLSGAVKLPQMQWNMVTCPRPSAMFPGEKQRWFYFVHSYGLSASPDASAMCEYGGPVVAAVERDNLWGVQFHPEKSSEDGLELLARFVERCDSSALRYR